MDTLVIAMIVIFIFIMSCDNVVQRYIREFICKATSSVAKVSPFSKEDNYEILPDPMFEGDRKESFSGSREPVVTWEPSTAIFDSMDPEVIYKSYAEDLKSNVDEAIVESHREYIADSNFLATTGASHASDRDDFRPPIQFHGLPRGAHYSALGSESTSRTSQSETPEDVVDIAIHHSTDYAL
jgi:hypothetical protein